MARTTQCFDLRQARRLGDFERQAYNLFLNPGAFAVPDGYTLVHKLYADDISTDVPDYVVFGFIVRSDASPGDVVVAIRGTEDVWEWIKDFEFCRRPFPYLQNAGESEDGFTSLYATLRIAPEDGAPRAVDALRDLLGETGPGATLHITGHSLGSALATLLALDVAGNGVFPSPTVYTFASPAVGDKTFAGVYDRLVPDTWRIVNQPDVVPHVPPAFIGYCHVDTEYLINSGDTTKHSIACWHALGTYLHTLSAAEPPDPLCGTVAEAACAPTPEPPATVTTAGT